MSNGVFSIPRPHNEPVHSYLPGDPERTALQAALAARAAITEEIPAVIGGKEIFTGDKVPCVMPHDHAHVLAYGHLAGEAELKAAAEAAMTAKPAWEAMPWEHRAAIFLKAAELLTGPYRAAMNASTMLGQSKTVYQAEIDCVCEMADFLRFNVAYAREIYAQQPNNAPGVWNRMEYRPLEGFVLAVSPFNFTSIGGNLPSAPAIMGNTVVWKPSTTALVSNYLLMRVFREAGLPDGVINFVPCRGADVSRVLVADSRLAGFHFTGSTEVFSDVWSRVGQNIRNYRTYPRLVGETGGKDFVFAHPTADAEALTAALARGAFEYQGQKCSAASRAFLPESLWERIKNRLLERISEIKVGDVADFSTFMGAVIDEKSFKNIEAYILDAQNDPNAEVLCGGCNGEKGWFVDPTVILAKSPEVRTLKEEVFGPVLTIFVYPDEELEQALALCDAGSPYGLTGAVFANDRQAILHMEYALRNAAGNFYINDKPTGAVVGQQPFGGARASGTNDKAGSLLNLLRWTSPRAIKETFVPSPALLYPYMEE